MVTVRHAGLYGILYIMRSLFHDHKHACVWKHQWRLRRILTWISNSLQIQQVNISKSFSTVVLSFGSLLPGDPDWWSSSEVAKDLSSVRKPQYFPLVGQGGTHMKKVHCKRRQQVDNIPSWMSVLLLGPHISRGSKMNDAKINIITPAYMQLCHSEFLLSSFYLFILFQFFLQFDLIFQLFFKIIHLPPVRLLQLIAFL